MSNAFLSQVAEWARDKFTNFLTFITGDHRYIHEGKAFTAIIETGSISSAYNISFTTPSVGYVHWRPSSITSSANYVGLLLYEGDSYTSGTAVIPFNRNRISSEVSLMSMVKGSTVTPAGTIIDIDGIGTSGNPTSRSGGAGGAEHELVLKQNTKYTQRLTPAGATLVTAKLFWYEEGMG